MNQNSGSCADSEKKYNKKGVYGELFVSFFKIGLFTFGGGYAMIPLIHREVAEKKKWAEDAEVVDILALAQSIPGVIAINSASIVGYKLKGRTGAIVATAGVILPSFIIITILAAFFSKFKDQPAVQAIFRGIRPGVAALIAAAAWKFAKSSVRDIPTAIIGTAALLASMFIDIHLIFIILASALAGLILHHVAPDRMYIFREGYEDTSPGCQDKVDDPHDSNKKTAGLKNKNDTPGGSAK